MRSCRQALFERPSHRRISKHIYRFKIYEYISTQTICGMNISRLACTGRFKIYEYISTQTICGMNISRLACTGSTVEASKVRKHRKIFTFKKFILPNCLDSATPARPNERDQNSRAVKMHRKKEKKRRGKGKRKEEKFGDLIAKKRKRSRCA